jgi:phosphomannomutase
LRASGTEPVYRIWAESRNVAEVETAVDQLQRLVIDRVESLKT